MTREQYFLIARDLRFKIADTEAAIEQLEIGLAEARQRLMAYTRRLGELKLPEAGDYLGRDDD